MDAPAMLSESQSDMLRAVHDRFAPALWRYAVSLTQDHQLAEDVVQEALLRAWRSATILDQDESSARAWLYTVVRNLVVDEKRSAWSRRESARDEVPEPGLRGTDHVDAALDSWLVTDALARLSTDHRTVIVQTFYLRRTIADVAGDLGIPPGTVKSRLHYGMQALRLSLQELGVTTP